ncbi:hypothetical protein FNN08_12695 [Thalassomonas sp. M1454]|nr:hypothetical protein FNN08_12695 [Thalassomonas sp. M1454]
MIVFCLLSISLHTNAQTPEQPLAEPLAKFQGFLGNWQSEMLMDDGKTKVTDVALWERALNGKAIRSTHSIDNGMYGGEMLLFWDKAQSSLVFYYFTTADFYTKGTIEVVSDNSFIAYEDVKGSQQGITKVKSTSTLVDGNMLVTTSYLKKGEWTKPESRTYKPSERKVIFK